MALRSSGATECAGTGTPRGDVVVENQHGRSAEGSALMSALGTPAVSSRRGMRTFNRECTVLGELELSRRRVGNLFGLPFSLFAFEQKRKLSVPYMHF